MANEPAGRLHPRARALGRSQWPVHTTLHTNEPGLYAACRLGKAAAAHEGEHACVVGQYIADEPTQPGHTGRIDQCRQQPFRQSAAAVGVSHCDAEFRSLTVVGHDIAGFADDLLLPSFVGREHEGDVGALIDVG